MNSNAQSWIAALRSEHYYQGQDGLQTDDGYCCLGVACDLYRIETGNGEWISPEWSGMLPVNKFFTFESNNGLKRDSFTLSTEVQDWLGMRTGDGAIGYGTDSNGTVQTLTALNDSGDYSFEQIADIIEEYEEDLFFEEVG